MPTRAFLFAALCLATVGGCTLEQVQSFLNNGVTVRVVNNTRYDVDPGVRIAEEDELFDILLSEPLATGVLDPGETAEFDFDCDRVGTVFSTDAVQMNLFGDAQAGESPTLQRSNDFDCGDVIEFEFTGDFGSFEVITRVNGRRIS